MVKILKEYSKILGYTFIGLVFGASFFLLFINFYHYKDISTVINKGNTDNTQTAEVNQKLQEIRTITDNFNPNTYSGAKNKVELMTINSKLQLCLKEYESEELKEIFEKTELDITDVYRFQNVYQSKIVNNCVVTQLYELGLTGDKAKFTDPDLLRIAPFIKLNADKLRQDTDYVYKVLLNNGSYYFSSETSKTNIFEMTKDSYYQINNSYLSSVDFVLEVARWFNRTVGGV